LLFLHQWTSQSASLYHHHRLGNYKQ
jgi:hypothetical protein